MPADGQGELLPVPARAVPRTGPSTSRSLAALVAVPGALQFLLRLM